MCSAASNVYMPLSTVKRPPNNMRTLPVLFLGRVTLLKSVSANGYTGGILRGLMRRVVAHILPANLLGASSRALAMSFKLNSGSRPKLECSGQCSMTYDCLRVGTAIGYTTPTNVSSSSDSSSCESTALKGMSGNPSRPSFSPNPTVIMRVGMPRRISSRTCPAV